jgi:hypothetical protein
VSRVKTNSLTDKQRHVVATIRMRLTQDQSLIYLKDQGYEMSRRTYGREKRKVEDMKLKRLYHIAKIGFEDQHLERIDQLELIQRLMWDEYNKEENPFKRACILEKIASIQPYLSNYYDTTKEVMRDRTDPGQSREDNIIPQHSA